VTRRALAASASLLAATLSPPAVLADFVPELPGTDPMPTDARSAAMGSAGIASSEESSSLLLNPAALGLIRRGEITASILYQKRELESGYFDDARSADLSSGEFSSVGFVYPVPVFRGALTFGFLFHRQFLFDRDLLRGGAQPTGGDEAELLSEQGSMNHWTMGAAVQVSPSSFIGGMLSIVSGTLGRTSDFAYTSPDTDYVFVGTDDMDLSGFRGSFGGLFFPSPALRLGFRLDLPYTVSYEGRQRVEGELESFLIDDEVSYPLAAGAGVAARVSELVLTGELEFRPYSLLELNGRRLRTEDRVEGYRDVVVARVGAEYTLPFPARARLGYRYEPDPYRLLLAEVRNEDPGTAVMEVAELDQERHVFSGGIGILMEDALAVDGALEWSRSEKSATNVDQTDDVTRFLLTTSYRF
jgi:hypothetical protein